MDITEKLGLWGATHTRARRLERAAGQDPRAAETLRQEARQLRESADRLHREIYDEIGRRQDRPS